MTPLMALVLGALNRHSHAHSATDTQRGQTTLLLALL